MTDIFTARRRRTRGLAPVIALYAAAVWDVVETVTRVHADLLRQDLRYACRTLMRAKSYAVTAIVIPRSASAPRPPPSRLPTTSSSARCGFPLPTAS